MDFFAEVKKVLDNRTQLTENGAVGYETTGKYLLDMNFKVASYRSRSEQEILNDFIKAYAENSELATKWVFYVGDVREGLGERRLFRILIKELAVMNKNLIKFIGEYNRFDSLLVLFDTPAEEEMLAFVKEQLYKDIAAVDNSKPCSLLAKWMPSINTSSEKSKAYARRFISAFDMTEKEYRKTLSKLRSAIDVVEKKLCANQWGEVNYNTVPSKANLKYKDSFIKHDEKRRTEWLKKLEKGDKTVKINSNAVFPHDILYKYSTTCRTVDTTYEEMWKALPNTISENKNLIVVRDGSGSMLIRVDQKSRVRALDVATALAIYTSEHLPGALENKFITFSSKPQLVDLTNCKSLYEKIKVCNSYGDCSNTDIERTFDLLLNVVSKNNMKQEEIPDVLIISDMEFDGATTYCYSGGSRPSQTLFDHIADKWKTAGYDMPKLIFWNVNSRTNTIPVKQNSNGVALISGFSQNTVKMAMSNELDPFKALTKVLLSKRYEQIV